MQKFPNTVACNNYEFVIFAKVQFKDFYKLIIFNLPGSQVTPTLEATSSPKDLVIASPGMSSFFNHTLNGPIGFLS